MKGPSFFSVFPHLSSYLSDSLLPLNQSPVSNDTSRLIHSTYFFSVSLICITVSNNALCENSNEGFFFSFH